MGNTQRANSAENLQRQVQKGDRPGGPGHFVSAHRETTLLDSKDQRNAGVPQGRVQQNRAGAVLSAGGAEDELLRDGRCRKKAEYLQTVQSGL